MLVFNLPDGTLIVGKSKRSARSNYREYFGERIPKDWELVPMQSDDTLTMTSDGENEFEMRVSEIAEWKPGVYPAFG